MAGIKAGRRGEEEPREGKQTVRIRLEEERQEINGEDHIDGNQIVSHKAKRCDRCDAMNAMNAMRLHITYRIGETQGLIEIQLDLKHFRTKLMIHRVHNDPSHRCSGRERE